MAKELALEGLQEAGPLETKPWLKSLPVYEPVTMVSSWAPNRLFVVLWGPAEIRHAGIGGGKGDLITRLGGVTTSIHLAVDHRRHTVWAFLERGAHHTTIVRMREVEGGGWVEARKEVNYLIRRAAARARSDGAVLVSLAGVPYEKVFWYYPDLERLTIGVCIGVGRSRTLANGLLSVAVVEGDNFVGLRRSSTDTLLSICSAASNTPYRYFHKISNAVYTFDHAGHLLAFEGRPSGTLWLFRDGQVTRHRVWCEPFVINLQATICVMHSGHVAVCHAGMVTLVGPVPGVVPPPLPLWSPRAHRRHASSLHRFVAMVLMCANRANRAAAPLPRLAFVHWERILSFVPMNHMLVE